MLKITAINVSVSSQTGSSQSLITISIFVATPFFFFWRVLLPVICHLYLSPLGQEQVFRITERRTCILINWTSMLIRSLSRQSEQNPTFNSISMTMKQAMRLTLSACVKAGSQTTNRHDAMGKEHGITEIYRKHLRYCHKLLCEYRLLRSHYFSPK